MYAPEPQGFAPTSRDKIINFAATSCRCSKCCIVRPYVRRSCDFNQLALEAERTSANVGLLSLTFHARRISNALCFQSLPLYNFYDTARTLKEKKIVLRVQPQFFSRKKLTEVDQVITKTLSHRVCLVFKNV